MSALIPGDQEGREVGGDLSKRELMKLEKAFRRLESQQNQEIKHPKRRGHSSHHTHEPNRRKEIKIDPSPARSPHDQIYSSPINSSEPLSTTPPQPAQPPRDLPTHLNPHYRLPEGEAAIFNYLLCYSYNEEEKRLEKEAQDWGSLDQLGQGPLVLAPSSASIALCQKLNTKIREVKDRLREPLGKVHREVNQKFLKKNSFNSYSLQTTQQTIHCPSTTTPLSPSLARPLPQISPSPHWQLQQIWGKGMVCLFEECWRGQKLKKAALNEQACKQSIYIVIIDFGSCRSSNYLLIYHHQFITHAIFQSNTQAFQRCVPADAINTIKDPSSYHFSPFLFNLMVMLH